MKVVVLGGGAAGMTAAIFAAENGASVTVLEKKEQLGKKLSITGNGKCNYGNLYMAPRYYYGHSETFIKNVLMKVPEERVIDWFESLGMLSISKKNYLYPATQNAVTVVQTLKRRMELLDVECITDCEVLSVKAEVAFEIETSKGTFSADKVVFALGSEAGVHDKTAFCGYELLENLGHSVYRPLPALCGLVGNGGFESLWAGVRTEAAITYRDATEEGEVQFTKDGISGIPVFQLSHPIISELQEKKVLVSIDFLPNYDKEALKEFLFIAKSHRQEETVLDEISLWIPKKICSVFLKKEDALLHCKLSELSEGQIAKIVRLVKEFPYQICGYESLQNAQVVNGGLSCDEVYDTMESKLVPGLYFAGEILDVDGKCGGYNLHFAFATGRIAGEECTKC